MSTSRPDVSRAPSTAHGVVADHRVQFYEDESALADSVGAFLGEGLEAGDSVLIVSPEPRRHAIERLLRARGLSPDRLAMEGRYVHEEAGRVLSDVLSAGRPDPERFERALGALYERATNRRRGARVRAFGEMVSLLYAEGRREAAIDLERLWNAFASRRSLGLLCAYPLAAFSRESDGGAFARICAEHDSLLPSGEYARLASKRAREEHVVGLQRRVAALEGAEDARRRAQDLLERRERELSDLLDTTRDGVIDLTPAGDVRYANAAFLRALGWPSLGFVGASLSRFCPSPIGFAGLWNSVVRGARPDAVRVRLQATTGEPVDAVVHSARLRVDDEEPRLRCHLSFDAPPPAPPAAPAQSERGATGTEVSALPSSSRT
jgi:PAS domain-containing protein